MISKGSRRFLFLAKPRSILLAAKHATSADKSGEREAHLGCNNGPRRERGRRDQAKTCRRETRFPLRKYNNCRPRLLSKTKPGE
jgi:hypothetical protein